MDLLGEGPGAGERSFDAPASDVSDAGVRITAPLALRPGQGVRLRAARGEDPRGVGPRDGALARVVWVAQGRECAIAGLATITAAQV